MGRLTTHILDTTAGRPGAGIRVELFRISQNGPDKLAEARTNADGRVDQPLLSGADYSSGVYELVFHVGEYFAAGQDGPGQRFLELVPIRFGLDAGEDHYHVPLLVSPHGYTTYRGS